MVILIMQKEEQNLHLNIDWDALDKSWADQYEDDYARHFSDMYLNGIRTQLHVSAQCEEGISTSI